MRKAALLKRLAHVVAEFTGALGQVALAQVLWLWSLHTLPSRENPREGLPSRGVLFAVARQRRFRNFEGQFLFPSKTAIQIQLLTLAFRGNIHLRLTHEVSTTVGTSPRTMSLKFLLALR